MRRRWFATVLIAGLMLGLAVMVLAQDLNIGTWKMNPAKSKIAFKSLTMKFEAQKDFLKVVQNGVGPDGKEFQRSWTSKCDGKSYKVTAPDADSMTCTMPDANTTDYAFKKNGKDAFHGRAVISKDGKTNTDNGVGANEKGQQFSYSVVMEKQ